MSTYNLTLTKRATNMADLLLNLDNVTGNIIGSSILLVIFSIFFVKFIEEGPKVAYAASIVITAIVAILMAAMGVIAFEILIFVIVMAAIGGVMMLFQ